MKILVLALSGLGDALMFSPALKLLRARYPEAQIDLLAMFKGVEELYARNPDVSQTMYRDFLGANPFASLFFVLGLRRKKYDVSINVYPANRWPYNVISRIIGAPKRLGHCYNHLSGRSLNMLNNVRVREDDHRHNVEENLRLVRLLGVGETTEAGPLQVHLTVEDRAAGAQWFRDHGIGSNDFVVGFHAGSALFKNHIRRRWAPEKFAGLGARLASEGLAKILLFGGPEEYELNERINAMMNGAGIVVKTPTLMSSVSIMERCSVFVVNDSGLMHIAAGLRLPIVTIFAYTNPRFVHPWQTEYRIIRRELECSPCFYYSPRPASCRWREDRWRCITHIGVEEVYDAVITLAGRTPGDSNPAG